MHILDHAEDRVLFVDLTFVPLVERLVAAASPPARRRGGDDRSRAHAGAGICRQASRFTPMRTCWPRRTTTSPGPSFDENTAAALCYTSGTTGQPKGVLYSHRSTVLHTYGINLPDVIGLRAVDRALPIVAMFHVNAWGIPYAATMAGAALVFAGAKTDGASLHELILSERVTYAAAVPTVWLGLLEHLRQTGGRLDGLERICVGGAACPQLLLETFGDEYGVRVNQGWGMTEMSPVGAYNCPKPGHREPSGPASYPIRLKQGRPMFGVTLGIIDADGRGAAVGRQ